MTATTRTTSSGPTTTSPATTGPATTGLTGRPQPAEPAKSAEPPEDASVEEIEKHIEQTRQELGDTVAALAHKLDEAQASVTRPRTVLVAAVPVVLAVAAGVIVWARKR